MHAQDLICTACVYGMRSMYCVLIVIFLVYINFCRGFNDAINGFNDDGWSLMNSDGAEDVIVAVNSTKNLCTTSNTLSLLGGILCAKASMLLQVNYEVCIINVWSA